MQWAPTLFVAAMYVVAVISVDRFDLSIITQPRSLGRVMTLAAIIGVMALSTLYNISDAPFISLLGWVTLLVGSWCLLALGYLYDCNPTLLGICCLMYPPIMFIVTGGLSAHLHDHTVKWLIFIAVPGYVVAHLPSSVRQRRDKMVIIYGAVALLHWLVLGDVYREWYQWYDSHRRWVFAVELGAIGLVVTAMIWLVVDAAIKWLFRRRYSWLDIVRGRQVSDAIAAEQAHQRLRPPRPPHVVWERDHLER